MPPIASTPSGRLEGREKDGVLLFAGIPYAVPPTGALRLRAPEPYPAWQGERAAKRFGPAAPQRPGEGLTSAPTRWDEDCLTLNVQTPSLDGPPRPVLVWIHGGAFRTGKGGIPWYNGHSFATRGDIVTVTINYRLGALGFLHLDGVPGAPQTEGSGCLGILDQIAALEWVRDHIAAFGGDPERVTIAGESAGGMSVGTLLGTPRARGLFRGAIAQSGAAHSHISPASARAVAGAFLEELGVANADGLATAEAESILDAQAKVEARAATGDLPGLDEGERSLLSGMVFRPVVGADLLPEPPLDVIRRGDARDVAVLIGTNADETTLWQVADVDDARATRIFEHHLGAERATQALETYRAARPGASGRDLVVAMTTDHGFRIPAVRLAEAQGAAGGPVWKYFFSWKSRGFGGRLGATHALEIPFAFNTLNAPGVDAFLGEGPAPVAVAEAMHETWTRFVRDHEADWPRYDANERIVREFGDEMGLLRDPAPYERALWDGIR